MGTRHGGTSRGVTLNVALSDEEERMLFEVQRLLGGVPRTDAVRTLIRQACEDPGYLEKVGDRRL
jgi:hypothetical protein